MEAVKQGSATVALCSKTHAIVASLNRQASDLASYQKKIFKIDEHMGIGISGLIADARVLARYMRGECLNHRYVYGTSMPVGRLVTQVSDKSQVYTQKSEKRPYGVGLLVVGVDKTGPHVFNTDPSGNFYEYKAFGIGNRSQASKTYLEKHFEEFADLELEDLIVHALQALKGAAQDNLTTRNCSIGFVSKDKEFTLIENGDLAPYIAKLSQDDDDDDNDSDSDSDADGAVMDDDEDEKAE